MLEKPDLPDELILVCLKEDYGVEALELTFLPLGADQNTAAYRASDGGTAYFVKLRRGELAETAVSVPHYLSRQGIRQIIAPLENRAGRLHTGLGHFQLILYPFITGQNCYSVQLTGPQWVEFGAALRAIHNINLPGALAQHVQPETYAPHGRQAVLAFLTQVEQVEYPDRPGQEMAALLRARRGEIQELVARAEHLAGVVQDRPPQPVLCHSDIHPANLLVAADGSLYIVDWDQPVLAPRERDLMFIGGGMGGLWSSAWEVAQFYQGYGPVEIDWAALAYYRCERIVQDIAEFCNQVLASTSGGDDRPQAVIYLASQFAPGSEIDMANKTYAGYLQRQKPV